MKPASLFLAAFVLLGGCAELTPEQVSDMQYFGQVLNNVAIQNEQRNFQQRQLQIQEEQVAAERLAAVRGGLIVIH